MLLNVLFWLGHCKYVVSLTGRLHLSMGLLDEALSYLQQGLDSAQASGKREDEAKIRHQVFLLFKINILCCLCKSFEFDS